MSITTVLFDLDGTLLSMDQDTFLNEYFRQLATCMTRFHCDPKATIDALEAGVVAMAKNDGCCSNEELFWKVFSELLGSDAEKCRPGLESFYENEYQLTKCTCTANPEAAEIIAKLKAAGVRTVLATNPFFPRIATESRMRWGGMKPEDFELYTTFENSSHCKPNLDYYREILDKLGVKPEECVMIGNDVSEDMIAEQLGMKVFLLTGCLINRENKDISAYPHGGFKELNNFLDQILN